jgi:hypothetical protein
MTPLQLGKFHPVTPSDTMANESLGRVPADVTHIE